MRFGIRVPLLFDAASNDPLHQTYTLAQEAEAAGVDAAFISELVDRFYERIRGDEVLGPIFGRHISNWGPHLDRMKAFWRSILHNSAEFSGNPMQRHMAVHRVPCSVPVRLYNLDSQFLAKNTRVEAEQQPEPAAREAQQPRAGHVAFFASRPPTRAARTSI